MAGEIMKLLELHQRLIEEEKKRLQMSNNTVNTEYENCDNEHQQPKKQQQSTENKENHSELSNPLPISAPNQSLIKIKNLPLIERPDLSSNDGHLGEKQAFIDKLANSDSPFLCRLDDKSNNKMLRYGEYSPNNPQVRVTAAAAAPYLGLGEYEQRRNYFLQKQRAEYLEHLSKKNQKLIEIKNCLNSGRIGKEVQTDLQNIHCPLVQYELESLRNNVVAPEKDLNHYHHQSHHNQSPTSSKFVRMHHNRHSYNLPSTSSSSYRNSGVDQRLTSAQNALLRPETMDKPKSILSNRRTGSPRERLMSDLKHSYTPSFMDGFSFQDRSDELERERLKRESYQHDLRLQIEEKRRYQSLRDEQDRREQDLENRRLEQQLLRMQEEAAVEEQRRSRRDEQMRRHSEDLIRRKAELQSRTYRKHTDSESSLRNNVATSSHYSPPVSRRNAYHTMPSTSVFGESRFDSYYRKDALNRMDSLNSYDNYGSSSNSRAAFNRYDSLSRIDSLSRQETLDRLETLSIRENLSNSQRRHSATQQDLSELRRHSPKLARRSNSSRFDETLPIPILKAHSPVAKELKHSIPFSSRHSTEAVRKLEDKWQIPAVQKNFVNSSSEAIQNRNILTQLGAIRMQLQQEQLRMDETLRKRGLTNSKAGDYH